MANAGTITRAAKKNHRKVSSPFSPQSQKRVWVGLGPPQWVDMVWHIHHCTNFQLMRSTPIFSAMFRSQKRKFLNHKVCNILRRKTTMDLNCLKSFALVQKKNDIIFGHVNMLGHGSHGHQRHFQFQMVWQQRHQIKGSVNGIEQTDGRKSANIIQSLGVGQHHARQGRFRNVGFSFVDQRLQSVAQVFLNSRCFVSMAATDKIGPWGICKRW